MTTRSMGELASKIRKKGKLEQGDWPANQRRGRTRQSDVLMTVPFSRVTGLFLQEFQVWISVHLDQQLFLY
jgi:hypothetical protein